jgi:hypothetical protein
MIKFNQELQHLKDKKNRLEKEMKNCSCHYGGIENGELTDNICFICPEKRIEVNRISKRIAKIKMKIKNNG